MPSPYARSEEQEQEGQELSQEGAKWLEEFLSPLLLALDRIMDKRLVRTLVRCGVAIIGLQEEQARIALK